MTVSGRSSVPPILAESLQERPAASFNLLPVVERDVWDSWDHSYPVAPAIPMIRDDRSWIMVDWLVVRCPFCGDYHTHHDVMAIHPPDRSEALEHSCQVLGVKTAQCTRIRPLTRIRPDKTGDTYASAKYFIVGIDAIPTTEDLNTYFPMTKEFITAYEPKPGYVYLIEAGGRHKIGVASDIDRRIRELSTASPFPIESVYAGLVENPYQLEKALHRWCGSERVHLEWFVLDDNLIEQVITRIRREEVPA